MATPALIDLSNYSTLLKLSTQGRSGIPDGNIFPDYANGRIEIITAEELPQIDFGAGLEANPLTNALGIKMEALYAFERLQRHLDETLRTFDRMFKGVFRDGGAFTLINGYKFDDASGTNTSSTTDDRFKIRGSGWQELDAGGQIGRIYFGVRSLGNILPTSAPYYQLAAGGVPQNFSKVGPVDEPIQVYGDATVDSTTTTFDSRSYLSFRVRTFGQTHDEKVLSDSGIGQMGGYAGSFALTESPHLTTGNYNLADVYGVSQIAPWTGMSLEKLATPSSQTGFNEGAGSFTWVLRNTAGGTLDECVAFLDALAQTDDDIDSGTLTVTNGARVGTWYTYDAQGRIVTRSGADNLGLFIENLPVADEQRIVFTADDGTIRTRPFNVQVDVAVGAAAVADVNAWYHAYFLNGPGVADDFGTAGAITVQDNAGNPVKGTVSTDAVSNKISFGFDYDGDTLGGAAGTDKTIVFLCEGDGGVTAAKTVFTITRNAVVSATCEPPQETNL